MVVLFLFMYWWAEIQLCLRSITYFLNPRPLSNIYEFVKTMKMPLLYQNGKAPRRSAESGHELEDA